MVFSTLERVTGLSELSNSNGCFFLDLCKSMVLGRNINPWWEIGQPEILQTSLLIFHLKSALTANWDLTMTSPNWQCKCHLYFRGEILNYKEVEVILIFTTTKLLSWKKNQKPWPTAQFSLPVTVPPKHRTGQAPCSVRWEKYHGSKSPLNKDKHEFCCDSFNLLVFAHKQYTKSRAYCARQAEINWSDVLQMWLYLLADER